MGRDNFHTLRLFQDQTRLEGTISTGSDTLRLFQDQTQLEETNFSMVRFLESF